MNELEYDDIALLLDAVESWEAEGANKAFTSGLLGVMLRPGQSDQDIEESAHTVSAKMKAAANERKDQAITLKYKLVQIRNRLTAEAGIRDSLTE